MAQASDQARFLAGLFVHLAQSVKAMLNKYLIFDSQVRKPLIFKD
jgi:hypothetical protein